ncbi:MAG: hypothetical protein KKC75_04990 [Nanoarchaeota archaeon]|nr:hypothetical protein [Nanoarchaeota archaeon]MBU1005860.1 hypothetical protein [Nanoarchaeota archaeon]MBU1946123.1 hypothetical protein [Nanoarchaeota archaeon]
MTISKRIDVLGVAERGHKAQRGVVFIFLSDKDDSRTIDILKKETKFYTHKQIEIKDGLVFMRLKKRFFYNHA